MVVDRRHLEHALAGALVEKHLDDDAQRLDDEQPADDREHDFMMRRHRDRTKRAAQCEAAGIAHEHRRRGRVRSEEHTSELQSLMRTSYAVFCLKKKNTDTDHTQNT